MRKREIICGDGAKIWTNKLPCIAYYGRVIINARNGWLLEFRSTLAKQRKIHWKDTP